MSNSSKHQFAYYSANEQVFFHLKEFTISPLQLHSVADYEAWVDGQVIDAFASTFMTNWCDITYIPTDLLNKVLGRFSRIKTVNKSSIYTRNQDIGNKLLLPYCYDSHWRLLVVDINLKQLILLDPRLVSTDTTRVVEAFTSFIKDCHVTSPFRKLKDFNWTVTTGPTGRPYQPDGDIENCGVFCMYYLQCIYKNETFDNNFDPRKFRENIAHQLMLKADNARERCLFCARLVDFTKNPLTCSVCKLNLHADCKFNESCPSDTENSDEKINGNAKKKRKIIKQTSNLSVYTCRLLIRT
ncbi:hypothetical protein KQX54_014869 [Cotesia glomerata]|uniref:Ubiquitin-like protease family profile domain-containing protein n=1 Tax=Cotesia glomerata TaxID=32391 RepID=A0AAV7J723_COTGL|nr:hypothetical protein KQX54_014869 [Cotesia glomerata]